MNLRRLLQERFTGCELAVLLWVAAHGRCAGQHPFAELPYHRGSVGRARRELQHGGWIEEVAGVYQLGKKALPYFADTHARPSSSEIQQLPESAKPEPPAQVAKPVAQPSRAPSVNDQPPAPEPAETPVQQPTRDARNPLQKARDDVLKGLRGL